MAKVTLSTIASHTGLSKYAVSRSLSGKDGVSEETRRLVREVATELGYLRDARKVPRILGIVFPDTDHISAEHHLVVQSAFQEEAQRLGYQPQTIWTNRVEDVLGLARDCAGLAIAGNHDAEMVRQLRNLSIPLARGGIVEALDDIDVVRGGDYEAATAVGQHLAEFGHRDIVYVQGAEGYRGRRERYQGFREYLASVEGTQLRQMAFASDETAEFVPQLQAMQNDGFHPTAFFCGHDGLALTVVTELLRLGYRIPEDMTVVGFGDYAAALQITPHLTTVRMQGRAIGIGLARVLDDRLNKRWAEEVPIRLLFADRLIIRASSGPVRKRK